MSGTGTGWHTRRECGGGRGASRWSACTVTEGEPHLGRGSTTPVHLAVGGDPRNGGPPDARSPRAPACHHGVDLNTMVWALCPILRIIANGAVANHPSAARSSWELRQALERRSVGILVGVAGRPGPHGDTVRQAHTPTAARPPTAPTRRNTRTVSTSTGSQASVAHVVRTRPDRRASGAAAANTGMAEMESEDAGATVVSMPVRDARRRDRTTLPAGRRSSPRAAGARSCGAYVVVPMTKGSPPGRLVMR